MIDYIALVSKLNAKLNSTYPPPVVDNQPAGYNNIVSCYDTYFIYEIGGCSYRVDFTCNPDGDCILGNRTEVEEQYVPKGTLLASESMSVSADGKLIDDGWTWPIDILSEGLTKGATADLSYWGVRNKKGYKFYTADSLKDAAQRKVFEARPLVLQPESDHTAWGQSAGARKLAPNEESENTFGMVTDTETVTRNGKTVLRGYAKLSRNKAGEAVREHLLKASEATPGNALIDLSWTGPYEGTLLDPNASSPIVQVNSITEAVSIIPCEVGNAGGRVLRAAESHPTQPMKEKKLIPGLILALNARKPKNLKGDFAKALRAAEAAGDGDTASEADESAVIQLFLDNNPAVAAVVDSAEDFAKNPKCWSAIAAWIKDEIGGGDSDAGAGGDTDAGASDAGTGEAAKAAESFKKELAKVQHRLSLAHLDSQLAEAKALPNPVKEALRTSITARAAESLSKGSFLDTATIDTEIANAKNMAAAMVPENSRVVTNISIGNDRLKEAVMSTMFFNAKPEVAKAAEGLLGYNPTDRKHYNARFTSFKKMLSVLNDDADPMDILQPSTARAAESYSTNVNNGLILDALHMRGLAAFYSPKWDEYKQVATADTSNDFRANHAINIGMPGQLTTTVDYTADFPELSIDGKEDTTLTLVGHGNIFSIRFDQIRNDVIGQIAQAPEKIFYGYKKGLYVTVFNNFLNGQSTNFSDGNPIFGTAHSNIVTGNPSLSGPAVISARNTMLQVPELGSTDASGLVPKYLIYGVNNHEAAYKILTPHAGMANEVATADQSLGLQGIEVLTWTNNNWFLQSDEVESIKIYYLDGKQEPELAQENPLAAISFTQMALRYRVHFPYIVGVVNTRPLVGSFAA